MSSQVSSHFAVESAFVQQTLPAYRLSWSPLKICPLLLLMGTLFLGMGIGIMKFVATIQEVKVPYTNCTSNERPGLTCYKILEGALNEHSKKSPGILPIFMVDANDIENCTCNVEFELKEPLKKTVYMYYALLNFYQNHLKYYSSRDENQLKGNLFDKDGNPKSLSTSCAEPFDTDAQDRIFYPCGLVANSMFTDVIDMRYYPNQAPPDLIKLEKDNNPQSQQNREFYRNENPQQVINVFLIKTGIAWESDRWDKYAYPEKFLNAKDPIWAKFAKPRGWKKSLWQLDPYNVKNNGVLNEDFLVWMRAAAFPWFRKLYRIVDSKKPFEGGLPAGNYSLQIQYNYDVSSFNGDKEIIFTTSAMVAGKNMFLAIVYMATGGVCMLLSAILFVVYKCCGFSKSKLIEDSTKKD